MHPVPWVQAYKFRTYCNISQLKFNIIVKNVYTISGTGYFQLMVFTVIFFLL